MKSRAYLPSANNPFGLTLLPFLQKKYWSPFYDFMAVLLLSFVTTAYSKFYKSTGTNTQTPQTFGDPSKKAKTLLCNKFFVFIMTLFFTKNIIPYIIHIFFLKFWETLNLVRISRDVFRTWSNIYNGTFLWK